MADRGQSSWPLQVILGILSCFGKRGLPRCRWTGRSGASLSPSPLVVAPSRRLHSDAFLPSFLPSFKASSKHPLSGWLSRDNNGPVALQSTAQLQPMGIVGQIRRQSINVTQLPRTPDSWVPIHPADDLQLCFDLGAELPGEQALSWWSYEAE
ncbi:hypothetical protein BO71DRAFT_41731 [Aspergillus ellipticus CBS 707.79]|uniref:Uncharacterized protein n=1 Tax=Aspergillus ellipticus CBS 707.79 TaxID=1448320 RepID=A0A319DPN3_9EURO|nr:hypothetical protein BO71DRAFT_41731 [Aspergillus ellipticus CBS 707.79]